VTETNSVTINERLTLYRRSRSGRWQARVKLNTGEWHRFSTGTADFEKAKESANRELHNVGFRAENNLPQSTRKFKRVAEYARDRMQSDLEAEAGKIVWKDYITAIDKYLIPFFGQMDVASINLDLLKRFDQWRTEKLGRPAALSTINTHNSALNRVLDEAELRGWITKAIRPTLLNKGVKQKSRGSFTDEEYEFIVKKTRYFHKHTEGKITRETREVLHNYALLLANTGIRHGTEALGLKWKHIRWEEAKDGYPYLVLTVSGKTGLREVVARQRTDRTLTRQKDLNPNLSHLKFDELLDQKLDVSVFLTRSGRLPDVIYLNREFKKLLLEHDLFIGSDGRPRTLYSLRHYYANKDLERGVSTHVLSRQMGNSTAVIDRFYSKLSPRLNADLHSGRKHLEQQRKDAKKPEVSDASNPVSKAYDMLMDDKITERAFLLACGVQRSNFETSDDLMSRALLAFEAGKLSEDGLCAILGAGNALD
jgi:integrase